MAALYVPLVFLLVSTVPERCDDIELTGCTQCLTAVSVHASDELHCYCSFKGHVLRIRQRPDALPEYYTVTLEYHGHVTSFGMAGVWFKLQEGVKEPVKEQVGVWAMYPAQRKSVAVNRPANRAETGENGQSSGWNMYEL